MIIGGCNYSLHPLFVLSNFDFVEVTPVLLIFINEKDYSPSLADNQNCKGFLRFAVFLLQGHIFSRKFA